MSEICTVNDESLARAVEIIHDGGLVVIPTDTVYGVACDPRNIEAIRKVCAGKHSDIEAKAIEEGWDEVRTELHVLRASRPQVPAVASSPRNTSPQVFEAVVAALKLAQVGVKLLPHQHSRAVDAGA